MDKTAAAIWSSTTRSEHGPDIFSPEYICIIQHQIASTCQVTHRHDTLPICALHINAKVAKTGLRSLNCSTLAQLTAWTVDIRLLAHLTNGVLAAIMARSGPILITPELQCNSDQRTQSKG